MKRTPIPNPSPKIYEQIYQDAQVQQISLNYIIFDMLGIPGDLYSFQNLGNLEAKNWFLGNFEIIFFPKLFFFEKYFQGGSECNYLMIIYWFNGNNSER